MKSLKKNLEKNLRHNLLLISLLVFIGGNLAVGAAVSYFQKPLNVGEIYQWGGWEPDRDATSPFQGGDSDKGSPSDDNSDNSSSACSGDSCYDEKANQTYYDTFNEVFEKIYQDSLQSGIGKTRAGTIARNTARQAAEQAREETQKEIDQGGAPAQPPAVPAQPAPPPPSADGGYQEWVNAGGDGSAEGYKEWASAVGKTPEEIASGLAAAQQTVPEEAPVQPPAVPAQPAPPPPPADGGYQEWVNAGGDGSAEGYKAWASNPAVGKTPEEIASGLSAAQQQEKEAQPAAPAPTMAPTCGPAQAQAFQEAQKLEQTANFFQKIWLFIKNFFIKIFKGQVLEIFVSSLPECPNGTTYGSTGTQGSTTDNQIAPGAEDACSRHASISFHYENCLQAIAFVPQATIKCQDDTTQVCGIDWEAAYYAGAPIDDKNPDSPNKNIDERTAWQQDNINRYNDYYKANNSDPCAGYGDQNECQAYALLALEKGFSLQTGAQIQDGRIVGILGGNVVSYTADGQPITADELLNQNYRNPKAINEEAQKAALIEEEMAKAGLEAKDFYQALIAAQNDTSQGQGGVDLMQTIYCDSKNVCNYNSVDQDKLLYWVSQYNKNVQPPKAPASSTNQGVKIDQKDDGSYSVTISLISGEKTEYKLVITDDGKYAYLLTSDYARIPLINLSVQEIAEMKQKGYVPYEYLDQAFRSAAKPKTFGEIQAEIQMDSPYIDFQKDSNGQQIITTQDGQTYRLIRFADGKGGYLINNNGQSFDIKPEDLGTQGMTIASFNRILQLAYERKNSTEVEQISLAPPITDANLDAATRNYNLTTVGAQVNYQGNTYTFTSDGVYSESLGGAKVENAKIISGPFFPAQIAKDGYITNSFLDGVVKTEETVKAQTAAVKVEYNDVTFRDASPEGYKLISIVDRVIITPKKTDEKTNTAPVYLTPLNYLNLNEGYRATTQVIDPKTKKPITIDLLQQFTAQDIGDIKALEKTGFNPTVSKNQQTITTASILAVRMENLLKDVKDKIPEKAKGQNVNCIYKDNNRRCVYPEGKKDAESYSQTYTLKNPYGAETNYYLVRGADNELCLEHGGTGAQTCGVNPSLLLYDQPEFTQAALAMANDQILAIHQGLYEGRQYDLDSEKAYQIQLELEAKKAAAAQGRPNDTTPEENQKIRAGEKIYVDIFRKGEFGVVCSTENICTKSLENMIAGLGIDNKYKEITPQVAAAIKVGEDNRTISSSHPEYLNSAKGAAISIYGMACNDPKLDEKSDSVSCEIVDVDSGQWVKKTITKEQIQTYATEHISQFRHQKIFEDVLAETNTRYGTQLSVVNIDQADEKYQKLVYTTYAIALALDSNEYKRQKFIETAAPMAGYVGVGILTGGQSVLTQIAFDMAADALLFNFNNQAMSKDDAVKLKLSTAAFEFENGAGSLCPTCTWVPESYERFYRQEKETKGLLSALGEGLKDFSRIFSISPARRAVADDSWQMMSAENKESAFNEAVRLAAEKTGNQALIGNVTNNSITSTQYGALLSLAIPEVGATAAWKNPSDPSQAYTINGFNWNQLSNDQKLALVKENPPELYKILGEDLWKKVVFDGLPIENIEDIAIKGKAREALNNRYKTIAGLNLQAQSPADFCLGAGVSFDECAKESAAQTEYHELSPEQFNAAFNLMQSMDKYYQEISKNPLADFISSPTVGLGDKYNAVYSQGVIMNAGGALVGNIAGNAVGRFFDVSRSAKSLVETSIAQQVFREGSADFLEAGGELAIKKGDTLVFQPVKKSSRKGLSAFLFDKPLEPNNIVRFEDLVKINGEEIKLIDLPKINDIPQIILKQGDQITTKTGRVITIAAKGEDALAGIVDKEIREAASETYKGLSFGTKHIAPDITIIDKEVAENLSSSARKEALENALNQRRAVIPDVSVPLNDFIADGVETLNEKIDDTGVKVVLHTPEDGTFHLQQGWRIETDRPNSAIKIVDGNKQVVKQIPLPDIDEGIDRIRVSVLTADQITSDEVRSVTETTMAIAGDDAAAAKIAARAGAETPAQAAEPAKKSALAGFLDNWRGSAESGRARKAVEGYIAQTSSPNQLTNDALGTLEVKTGVLGLGGKKTAGEIIDINDQGVQNLLATRRQALADAAEAAQKQAREATEKAAREQAARTASQTQPAPVTAPEPQPPAPRPAAQQAAPPVTTNIIAKPSAPIQENDVLVLGRESFNGPHIQVDDAAVSGHHAKIRVENGEVRIYDQATTNGTFVNTKRITAQSLVDGDKIQLGSNTEFTFKVNPDGTSKLVSQNGEELAKFNPRPTTAIAQQPPAAPAQPVRPAAPARQAAAPPVSAQPKPPKKVGIWDRLNPGSEYRQTQAQVKQALDTATQRDLRNLALVDPNADLTAAAKQTVDRVLTGKPQHIVDAIDKDALVAEAVSSARREAAEEYNRIVLGIAPKINETMEAELRRTVFEGVDVHSRPLSAPITTLDDARRAGRQNLEARFDSWFSDPSQNGKNHIREYVENIARSQGLSPEQTETLVVQVENSIRANRNNLINGQIARIKPPRLTQVSGRPAIIEVATSDPHGDWNQLVRLLSGQAQGQAPGSRPRVLDARGQWIGGKNHRLRILGDMLDRAEGTGMISAQTAENIRLLQISAGVDDFGENLVEVNLGNHETIIIMQMRKFDDYINKGTPIQQAADLVSNQYSHGYAFILDPQDIIYLHQHRDLLTWLKDLPAMSKSGDILYFHSNTFDYRLYGATVEEINQNIRAILYNGEATFTDAWGRQSKKTIKELAEDMTQGNLNRITEFTILEGQTVDDITKHFGVNRLVHGHDYSYTPRDQRVTNLDRRMNVHYGLSDDLGSLGDQRGAAQVTQHLPAQPGTTKVVFPALSDSPQSRYADGVLRRTTETCLPGMNLLEGYEEFDKPVLTLWDRIRIVFKNIINWVLRKPRPAEIFSVGFCGADVPSTPQTTSKQVVEKIIDDKGRPTKIKEMVGNGENGKPIIKEIKYEYIIWSDDNNFSIHKETATYPAIGYEKRETIIQNYTYKSPVRQSEPWPKRITQLVEERYLKIPKENPDPDYVKIIYRYRADGTTYVEIIGEKGIGEKVGRRILILETATGKVIERTEYNPVNKEGQALANMLRQMTGIQSQNRGSAFLDPDAGWYKIEKDAIRLPEYEVSFTPPSDLPKWIYNEELKPPPKKTSLLKRLAEKLGLQKPVDPEPCFIGILEGYEEFDKPVLTLWDRIRIVFKNIINWVLRRPRPAEIFSVGFCGGTSLPTSETPEGTAKIASPSQAKQIQQKLFVQTTKSNEATGRNLLVSRLIKNDGKTWIVGPVDNPRALAVQNPKTGLLHIETGGQALEKTELIQLLNQITETSPETGFHLSKATSAQFQEDFEGLLDLAWDGRTGRYQFFPANGPVVEIAHQPLKAVTASTDEFYQAVGQHAEKKLPDVFFKLDKTSRTRELRLRAMEQLHDGQHNIVAVKLTNEQGQPMALALYNTRTNTLLDFHVVEGNPQEAVIRAIQGLKQEQISAFGIFPELAERLEKDLIPEKDVFDSLFYKNTMGEIAVRPKSPAELRPLVKLALETNEKHFAAQILHDTLNEASQVVTIPQASFHPPSSLITGTAIGIGAYASLTYINISHQIRDWLTAPLVFLGLTPNYSQEEVLGETLVYAEKTTEEIIIESYDNNSYPGQIVTDLQKHEKSQQKTSDTASSEWQDWQETDLALIQSLKKETHLKPSPEPKSTESEIVQPVPNKIVPIAPKSQKNDQLAQLAEQMLLRNFEFANGTFGFSYLPRGVKVYDLAGNPVDWPSEIRSHAHELLAITFGLGHDPEKIAWAKAALKRHIDSQRSNGLYSYVVWSNTNSENAEDWRATMPVVSYEALELYKIEGEQDTSFLQETFVSGVKNQGWWDQNRIGERGFYRWESHWESVRDKDNLPVWKATNGAENQDALDLQSYKYKEWKTLAEMAEKLAQKNIGGSPENKSYQEWAQYYHSRAEGLKQQMSEKMWNEGKGTFFGTDNEGKHVEVYDISIFLPLWAGIATQEQADKIVHHLNDPNEFNAPHGIPSLAMNDPAYTGEHWFGANWPEMTYLIVKGLEDYGYKAEAQRIIENSQEMFEKEGSWEYYDPLTGEGRGYRDYIWGALAAMPNLNI